MNDDVSPEWVKPPPFDGFDPSKVSVHGNRIGELPELPEGIYTAQLVAGDFVEDADGNMGFLWIFQIRTPRRHRRNFAVKLSRLDQGGDFRLLAGELSIVGLSPSQIVYGPVGELVAGRWVEIAIVRTSGKENISILRQIEGIEEIRPKPQNRQNGRHKT